MRTYVWAVVAGLALAYAIYGIATVDRRTDEQQILSLIDNTARAVENHNFSGAIEAVSKHYKDDSGLTYDRLRVLAAQAMREEITYKVSAKPGPVGILGDSASVQVRVTVTRPNGGILFARTLDVDLQKEKAWRALLIPTRVWRVTSAGNLGVDEIQSW